MRLLQLRRDQAGDPRGQTFEARAIQIIAVDAQVQLQLFRHFLELPGVVARPLAREVPSNQADGPSLDEYETHGMKRGGLDDLPPAPIVGSGLDLQGPGRTDGSGCDLTSSSDSACR